MVMATVELAFLFFFFYINFSVRNRTVVVTKHLGLLSIRKNQRSKTKQKTSQGLVTWSQSIQRNSHTLLCLCSAAEGVATTQQRKRCPVSHPDNNLEKHLLLPMCKVNFFFNFFSVVIVTRSCQKGYGVCLRFRRFVKAV